MTRVDPGWLSDVGVTLMAVVNVNADSFSDPRTTVDVDERVAAAEAAVAAGADVVDLGAQSAALAAREVPADEQIRVLVPLVAALHAAEVAVSVDTYDPVVTDAVLEAGATILNDYSGQLEPDILSAVADAGAWYVLTHNPVGPRRRQTDPRFYDDVIAHVLDFASRSVEVCADHGVDQILLDPGVDVSKTPNQTLELLRRLPEVRDQCDLPQLLAISRKDVLGALTGRLPADRDAATLALLDHVADQPRTLVRIHDVDGAVDYLRVRDALAGRVELSDGLLDDDLRREAP